MQMKKILIVPFKVESVLSDLDYLSEGVMEELNHLIVCNSALKITSRSTSVYLSNNSIPLFTIQERFDIDFVVEGNIHFKEGAYQLSTRLFLTKNEELLFSDKRVFELNSWTQSLNELAEIIIESAIGKGVKSIELVHSKAREYYLQGLYHWHRYTCEEILTAIRYFKLSIKEDREMAESYASLADSFCIIGMMGYDQPNEAFIAAKKYVDKALLINDKRSDSYVSAAFVDIYHSRDLARAKINLDQALRLNSANLKAHHILAMYHIHKREFDQAEKHAARTIKIDPLALPHHGMMIRIQLYNRKYQKALDFINAAMNIDHSSTALLEYRGYANLFMGNLESAIEDFKCLLAKDSLNPLAYANLGYAYSKGNYHRESRNLEAQIIDLKIKDDTGVFEYAMAIVKLGQLDYNAFFKYAERAVDLGIGIFPAELKCNPIFSIVREDSRFQHILDRCNLSDEKSTFVPKKLIASSIEISSQTLDSLVFDPQDLAFVKANDNYCTIYWNDSGILKNKMLRISLKRVEDQLSSVHSIVRCHKSFMINLNQDLSLQGNSRGYFLESNSLPIRIPVSRSKNERIQALYSEYQG